MMQIVHVFFFLLFALYMFQFFLVKFSVFALFAFLFLFFTFSVLFLLGLFIIMVFGGFRSRSLEYFVGERRVFQF